MFFNWKKESADSSKKVAMECPPYEDMKENNEEKVCPLYEDTDEGADKVADKAADINENHVENRDGCGEMNTEMGTDTPHHFINFRETRKYLQRVRGCKERLGLLRKRESLCRLIGQETDSLKTSIEETQQYQFEVSVEIADEISKLDNVKQEMVMTLRYIDGLTWDEISKAMDISLHTVHKLHGRALPAMERILEADGNITPLTPYTPYHHAMDGHDNDSHSDRYNDAYNDAEGIRDGYFSD